MSPAGHRERELLAAAASLTPDANRLRELAGQTDWGTTLCLAVRHRITPLLYWTLQGASAAVPAPVMAKLAADFEGTVKANLTLSRQLALALGEFERRSIPVIPYKGPALVQRLYQHPGLRVVRDLDLFIRVEDVPRSSAALETLGYRTSFPVRSAAEARRISQGELIFNRPDHSLIELHWEVLPRWFGFPVSREALWSGLETVSTGGRDVATFSKDNLLLLLCAHGTKHLWQQLRWLADVARLAALFAGEELAALTARARSLGMERMVLTGLGLAHGLLGLELPQAVRARITTTPETALWDDSEDRALSREWSYYLHSRERLADRLMQRLRFAFLPGLDDLAWARLPAPLCYAARPVRLALRYGPGALLRLARGKL